MSFWHLRENPVIILFITISSFLKFALRLLFSSCLSLQHLASRRVALAPPASLRQLLSFHSFPCVYSNQLRSPRLPRLALPRRVLPFVTTPLLETASLVPPAAPHQFLSCQSFPCSYSQWLPSYRLRFLALFRLTIASLYFRDTFHPFFLLIYLSKYVILLFFIYGFHSLFCSILSFGIGPLFNVLRNLCFFCLLLRLLIFC